MMPPAGRTHRPWLERSQLSVPASRWDMVEKAIASAADVAFLDLEDSVPPQLKVESRANVIRAVRELDWGSKPTAYRINALNTPFFYRDLIEIVEAAGDRLRLIIVPKVDRYEDLCALDALLGSMEASLGFEPGAIRLEAQIESAAGLVDVERIARGSERVESLIFGPGDFATSVRMPAASIGSPDRWDEGYPGHRFHYAMARIAVAARAAGRGVIDGPVADYRDLDALRRSCVAARGLGYDGKWCIHPGQVPIVNEVFSPTEEELSWARQVVEAYREATATGRGAITLGNTMIDAASIGLAETTLEQARRAGMLPEPETE